LGVRSRFLRASALVPAAALLGLAFAAASPAPSRRAMEPADLTAEPPVVGRPATAVSWKPDGRAYSFVSRDRGGDAIVWEEDAESGGRKEIASAAALSRDAGGIRFALDDARWSPDGRTLLLGADHDLWTYDAVSRALVRLTSHRADEEFPSFSPDGKRVAFVRADDLWVVELASKREIRLTHDGSESVHNGRLDWVYEEELANRNGRAYEWAPDSSAIAYARLDDTRVPTSPIVDYLAEPPSVKMLRYAKAGGPNAVASFHVVSTAGVEIAAVAFGAEDVYLLPHFSWTPDAKFVCYRVMTRSQRHQDVALLEPSTRKSRILFSEDDPSWLNAVPPPHFLNGGKYLWLSERDGFRHIYRGDVAGGPPSPVTRGRWMVDAIAGVDEKKGAVYFSATEESPRRRPLYRIDLDGRGFTKLTSERGTHRAQLSPDGRFLMDTFSNFATPPERRLLDAAGRTVRVAEKPENRLEEFALATTDEIEVRAADGETLLARLTKPAGFDPSRKYPVIVYLYGGPLTQVVRDAWGAVSLMD
jgi:dipeptidyl-peptidase-4